MIRHYVSPKDVVIFDRTLIAPLSVKAPFERRV
jgi:hypothetical protein